MRGRSSAASAASGAAEATGKAAAAAVKVAAAAVKAAAAECLGEQEATLVVMAGLQGTWAAVARPARRRAVPTAENRMRPARAVKTKVGG